MADSDKQTCLPVMITEPDTVLMEFFSCVSHYLQHIYDLYPELRRDRQKEAPREAALYAGSCTAYFQYEYLRKCYVTHVFSQKTNMWVTRMRLWFSGYLWRKMIQKHGQSIIELWNRESIHWKKNVATIIAQLNELESALKPFDDLLPKPNTQCDNITLISEVIKSDTENKASSLYIRGEFEHVSWRQKGVPDDVRKDDLLGLRDLLQPPIQLLFNDCARPDQLGPHYVTDIGTCYLPYIPTFFHFDQKFSQNTLECNFDPHWFPILKHAQPNLDWTRKRDNHYGPELENSNVWKHFMYLHAVVYSEKIPAVKSALLNRWVHRFSSLWKCRFPMLVVAIICELLYGF